LFLSIHLVSMYASIGWMKTVVHFHFHFLHFHSHFHSTKKSAARLKKL